MAKSSTQTFYETKGNTRNQTHKTRRQLIQEFVKEWTGKGEIKEDANRQPFIDDLLRRVCGIEQPTQYIEYEKDVQVKADGKPTTRRIDGYIPSTKVMWEMKGSHVKDLNKPILQSGGDLLSPYEQAKRYANFLPQNEYPRWIVVSNFLEIDIYDMNTPLAEPKVIKLEDLATNYKALDFLVDTSTQQIIDEKKLSIDAGVLVSKIYHELANAYSLHADLKDEAIQKSLNMLIVRLVFLLYADDTGILGDENIFQKFIERQEPSNIRQILMQLFKVLNTPENERDPFLSDDYKQFKYVNGGMFADENVIIPQFTDELKDLVVNEAGKGFNWSNISPTIFGAVFESTLNPDTRREGGMHYTSIENIHKVIDPLFLNDLNDEFDKIQNIPNARDRVASAKEFQDKLAKLKFFDPACGSGNFLTETYLSLRKMENKCLRIIVGNNSALNLDSDIRVKVKIQNYYGIEINDFAVSVARTAMWIAESQMWDESQNIIFSKKDFLPLDSNDSIYEGNALRMNWEDIVKPYDLNYIMGNPPFVGYSQQNKDQKADLKTVCVNKKGKTIPNVGKIDYVAGWYYKTARFIQTTTIEVSFVSTNSISQGDQVYPIWKSLLEDYNLNILFAYTQFNWMNEAKNKAQVHVVIIAFDCLMNKNYKVKTIFTNDQIINVKHISPYLKELPDILVKARTKPLLDIPKMVTGNRPADGGALILTPQEKDEFIAKEPKAQKWIKHFVGAQEYLRNKQRYCLWLVGIGPRELNEMPLVKRRVEMCKQNRLQGAPDRIKLAQTPWLFREQQNPRSYMIVPLVSSYNRKYIPIGYLDGDYIPSNRVTIIPDATKYELGILESSTHMAWMRTVTGRMEIDFNYSKKIVYNCFPWPKVDNEQKQKISETAQAILDARKLYPDSSLADLYDPTTMPVELRKAHEANDKAVLKAYGLKPSASESEIVQHLFKMYEQITNKEK